MKKIMFNDKYRLTQAVLDGRKTMTRREITNKDALIDAENGCYGIATAQSNYKVGEVVAIAQSYQKIFDTEGTSRNKFLQYIPFNNKGWHNKMFVKADLMPHHIRITNIRVERLQDISDEDCLREGITENTVERLGGKKIILGYTCEEKCSYKHEYPTPQDAFSALIDKVSGKGTWNRNPYVFVYDFELVD